jgi:hypothetical protein
LTPPFSVAGADGKVVALDRTKPETAVAERVRWLQLEARSLVGDHVRALEGRWARWNG